MSKVCANCGTEVDEDALFCPTCGQPLSAGAEPQLPPAPDWPAPPAREPEGSAAQATSEAEATPGEAHEPEADEPQPPQWAAPAPYAPMEPPGEARPWSTLAAAPPAASEPPAGPPPEAEPEPVDEPPDTYHTGAGDRGADSSLPPWRRGVAIRPTPPIEPAAATPSSPAVRPGAIRPEGLLTAPETVAGWLVSGGALIGLLAMLLPWRAGIGYTFAWGLGSGINLIFAIVLLAVLAFVLLPHMLPTIPRRDLWLAVIGLVGVGIGLDRFGIGFIAVGAVVFLIAMLALALGGLLAELGLDRRTGGPRP